MSTASVAAIDLGATSGRVILGRVSSDSLALTEVARFPNTPVSLPDGLHWDVLGLYGAAIDGLRAAYAVDQSIASIGVDSWGVDYGLLRDGRLIGNPYHYRDPRTRTGMARVHRQISPAELFARNGLQTLAFNTCYQLASEAPDVLGFADQLLFTPDLFGYWLTGTAATETTIASTSGLLSVDTGTWDRELMARLDLPERLVGDVIQAGQAVGALRPKIAAEVGADARARVTAVASHDTASAVVAVPMRAEAAVYISCGTWSLVGVEVDQPTRTPEVLDTGFTNEQGLDDRVRLMRTTMGTWLLSETLRWWSRGRSRPADLPSLLAAANEVPPDSVTTFDVDDSRFTAPGAMPPRIAAWCRERGLEPPGNRAEYVRSIVESMARALSAAVRDAARMGGVDTRVVHVVGGGARNDLLCRRIADLSGLPVEAGPVEATALGNILVQARALGVATGSIDSLRDLVRRTHRVRRFEPTSG